MVKLGEEAAKRAPKSEIEQIFEAEKKETLRRGTCTPPPNRTLGFVLTCAL